MGVGQPASTTLDLFGGILRAAFGTRAYQVGSTLTMKRGWRDVDVRVMLDDDTFTRLLGSSTEIARNQRLAAWNLAFSALGQQMTGLPIDFQVQRLGDANNEFDGPRAALGLGPFKLAADPSREG